MSWFTRAAKANCADTSRLFERLLKHTASSSHHFTDIFVDSRLQEEFLTALQPRVTVDLSEFEDFPHSMSQIETRHHGQNFLAHPSKNARYCPACLEEDLDPYFRYSWHLPFVTVCPVHRLLLRDRCPHCHAPVNYWATTWKHSITSCFRCGKPLTSEITFTSHARDEGSLLFQDRLLEVYLQGTLQAQPIDVESFFRDLSDYLVTESLDPGIALSLGPNAPISAERLFRALSLAFSAYWRDFLGYKVEDGPARGSTLERVNKIAEDYITRLNLPRGYGSQVLVDLEKFLARAPFDFVAKILHSRMFEIHVAGLVWGVGKFFGITQPRLGALIGRCKDTVGRSHSILKNWAREVGFTLPLAPSPDWADCILREVHGRFHLLSPEELAELTREFWTLDFPWRRVEFWARITFLAEYIYLYWAKCMGHRVPRLPKVWHLESPVRDLRQQLGKKLRQIKLERNTGQVFDFLYKFVKEGKLNSARYAPLTPFEAFRDYMQTMFPLWRGFTLHQLVAVLYSFVCQVNPKWRLSTFSHALGYLPSTIYSNCKRLGIHTTPTKSSRNSGRQRKT